MKKKEFWTAPKNKLLDPLKKKNWTAKKKVMKKKLWTLPSKNLFEPPPKKF